MSTLNLLIYKIDIISIYLENLFNNNKYSIFIKLITKIYYLN